MKSISARQTGIILFLTILANKILLLPSIMYEKTKADSLFVMFLLFVVELFVLWIFFVLKDKFGNKSLKDVLQNLIGKSFAKFLLFVFLIFFLFKTMLTYSVIYVYLKDLVYQDEFGFLALICFLPVVNQGVICGLRAMSRSFELFFYLVLAGIIFCLSIAFFTNVSFPYFFVSNPSQIFNTWFTHMFAFGDYLVLFIFMDKIHIKKGEKKKILSFVFLGIAIVLSIFLIFYCKYHDTAFMHNNALSDLLVFSVQFNAVGRLDIIAMITIMALGLFQMEIFQFAFCESFVMVFPKLSIKYAVAVFDVLFFIVYFVLIDKYELMIQLTTEYLPYFAVISNYILPILIFALSFKHKKEVKDAKTI